LEELYPLLQSKALVLKNGAPMGVKGLMGQRRSSSHFFAMITFMMNEATQVLILPDHCNVEGLKFTYDWQSARAQRSKMLCLESTDPTSSQREQHPRFALGEVGGHGMFVERIQQKGCHHTRLGHDCICRGGLHCHTEVIHPDCPRVDHLRLILAGVLLKGVKGRIHTNVLEEIMLQKLLLKAM
jgi:hypothetical protein